MPSMFHLPTFELRFTLFPIDRENDGFPGNEGQREEQCDGTVRLEQSVRYGFGRRKTSPFAQGAQITILSCRITFGQASSRPPALESVEV